MLDLFDLTDESLDFNLVLICQLYELNSLAGLICPNHRSAGVNHYCRTGQLKGYAHRLAGLKVSFYLNSALA